MLTGQSHTPPLWRRMLDAFWIGLHLYPFLLMGVSLIFVGVLAIGPQQKHFPELWICLPAGIAVLLPFIGMAYWLWWRLPGRTIRFFAWDGENLIVETPTHGSLNITSLKTVIESRGRRHLIGWWLEVEDHGWLFLEAMTPHAAELLKQLHVQPHHQV